MPWLPAALLLPAFLRRGESLSCTSPFGPAKRLSVKCNSAQRAPQNTDTKTQPPRLKMTWHVQFLFKFNSLEEGETDDLQ